MLQTSTIPGVLAAPCSNASVICLDAILIKVHAVWSRFMNLSTDINASMDEVRSLLHDAMSLDERFMVWSRTQPKEWLPVRFASLSTSQTFQSTFPIRDAEVDEYFDRK